MNIKIKSNTRAGRRRILNGPAAFCLLLSITAMAVNADPPVVPSADGEWYYEVGGAQPVTVPPNPSVTTIDLSAGVDLGLHYSCGKFDPLLGVTNILNDVKSGAEDMLSALVSAAGSAVASLPALILQRANPGLYDLFQNALARARLTISLANKTCEQMEKEISEGKNPYQDWINIAKSEDWRSMMGGGGSESASTDVDTARKTVEDNNGKNGVTWVGGQRKGGEDQPPIQVVTDITRAGYNVTLNRSDPLSSAPAPAGTRLSALWPGPGDAEAFARDVLGEELIHTVDGSAPTTQPGHGLWPKIEKRTAEVSATLGELIAGSLPLTPDNLEKVSAPGVAVSRQVIAGLRALPPSERDTAAGRLAAEAATAQVVEKAMVLRRLLVTGRQEPNVSVNQAAVAAIDDKIAVLEREIDDVLYESRIRKELSSNTALAVLRMKHRRARHESDSAQPELPRDMKDLEGGGIQLPESEPAAPAVAPLGP